MRLFASFQNLFSEVIYLENSAQKKYLLKATKITENNVFLAIFASKMAKNRPKLAKMMKIGSKMGFSERYPKYEFISLLDIGIRKFC